MLHLLSTSNHLVNLLERYQALVPCADEELACHRALCDALQTHAQWCEQSLDDWRQAISHRWDCEVAGQRMYHAVYRQLAAYYGADAPHLRALALTNPSNVYTAVELLANLRRVEAALVLLNPQPPFVEACDEQLRIICDDLTAAIDQTMRCEAQRRNVRLEQRITMHIHQQACEKTRKLLAEHLGNGIALHEPMPMVLAQREG